MRPEKEGAPAVCVNRLPLLKTTFEAGAVRANGLEPAATLQVEPLAKITVLAVAVVVVKALPLKPVPCVNIPPELNVTPLASLTFKRWAPPEKVRAPEMLPVEPAAI